MVLGDRLLLGIDEDFLAVSLSKFLNGTRHFHEFGSPMIDYCDKQLNEEELMLKDIWAIRVSRMRQCDFDFVWNASLGNTYMYKAIVPISSGAIFCCKDTKATVWHCWSEADPEWLTWPGNIALVNPERHILLTMPIARFAELRLAGKPVVLTPSMAGPLINVPRTIGPHANKIFTDKVSDDCNKKIGCTFSPKLYLKAWFEATHVGPDSILYDTEVLPWADVDAGRMMRTRNGFMEVMLEGGHWCPVLPQDPGAEQLSDAELHLQEPLEPVMDQYGNEVLPNSITTVGTLIRKIKELEKDEKYSFLFAEGVFDSKHYPATARVNLNRTWDRLVLSSALGKVATLSVESGRMTYLSMNNCGGCTENEGSESRTCPCCGVTRYCCRQCQKKGWSLHKAACRRRQAKFESGVEKLRKGPERCALLDAEFQTPVQIIRVRVWEALMKRVSADWPKLLTVEEAVAVANRVELAAERLRSVCAA